MYSVIFMPTKEDCIVSVLEACCYVFFFQIVSYVRVDGNTNQLPTCSSLLFIFPFMELKFCVQIHIG